MSYRLFTFFFACCLQLSLAQQGRHPQYEPQDPNEGGTGISGGSKTNIFLNCPTTASASWQQDTPDKAVDGNLNPRQYWGAENAPVWHQIDMGATKDLASIQFWPFWQNGRIYQFKIEGSLDGKSWKMLVDQTSNSITGTKDGFSYTFPKSSVRYVRTTITGNSHSKQAGGHIVEIQGFADAPTSQLRGAALDKDVIYPRSAIPSTQNQRASITETAWRGERVNALVAIWGDSPQRNVIIKGEALRGDGGSIPLNVSFLRYVLAHGKLHADVIDTNKQAMDIPAGTIRQVWISADIPPNTSPGVYRGTVLAKAEGSPPVRIPIEVTVQKPILPAPKDWAVHLDIWQHPVAVARLHGVPDWSPEHFALLKPIMQRLADSGQKTITCTLIDEAWGGQTYDWCPSMVAWTKHANGKWEFDFSVLEKYVDFMIKEVGITKQINCYTMLPWSMKVRYYDSASASYREMPLNINAAAFEEVWGAFLKSFNAFLLRKGWLDKACIAIDERSDELVRAAHAVIQKFAPKIRIASATNHFSQTNDLIYDISPVFHKADPILKNNAEGIKKRATSGKLTTFYVCVNPKKPNTFTISPPAESEWIGLFTAAHNFDGFLRWAYNSWGENPFITSDFGAWPSGDCFLVYPGNLSTPRWERLRDGLESYEKIRIIRAMASKPEASPALKKNAAALDSLLLELFTIPRGDGNQHATDVKRANEMIHQISL